jgi:energy-converting hydrogenase B subunit D
MEALMSIVAMTWGQGLLAVFDFGLCAVLVWLAIQTLMTSDLFKAIVMYMIFGLSLSLVWARLNAPDIALAEAAIGAGLTGALLLTTVAAVVLGTEGKE